MPSPPTVAYKAWLIAFAFFAFSSLPVYLVPVVLLIISQYASIASSTIELRFYSVFLFL